jgi:hypothetical protein
LENHELAPLPSPIVPPASAAKPWIPLPVEPVLHDRSLLSTGPQQEAGFARNLHAPFPPLQFSAIAQRISSLHDPLPSEAAGAHSAAAVAFDRATIYHSNTPYSATPYVPPTRMKNESLSPSSTADSLTTILRDLKEGKEVAGADSSRTSQQRVRSEGRPVWASSLEMDSSFQHLR